MRSVSRDFDDSGASVAQFDELANAGLADGDEREFGGGEECVDADQRQNREKLQGDHCWLILARGAGQ